MISREDSVFLLNAVSAETDRDKKLVGLRVMALLRKRPAAEPLADGVVFDIVREMGDVAGRHARQLLRTIGLV